MSLENCYKCTALGCGEEFEIYSEGVKSVSFCPFCGEDTIDDGGLEEQLYNNELDEVDDD